MKQKECQHQGDPVIGKYRVKGMVIIIKRCPKCGEEIGRQVEGE